MVTKSAFLYLSKSDRFKNFLTRFQSFNNVTRRFVAGEELTDAVEAIRKLNGQGISASFDHLGESITAEAETRKEVDEYVRVLDSIHENKLESNVSVKLTQLGLDVSQDLCYANRKDRDDSQPRGATRRWPPDGVGWRYRCDGNADWTYREEAGGGRRMIPKKPVPDLIRDGNRFSDKSMHQEKD